MSSVFTSPVLEDIKAERDYQDKHWGVKFDDQNTLNDWVTYIVSYCARAASMQTCPKAQRAAMVKVAALAVAACEAFDRNGQFPSRHYEEIVATD